MQPFDFLGTLRHQLLLLAFLYPLALEGQARKSGKIFSVTSSTSSDARDLGVLAQAGELLAIGLGSELRFRVALRECGQANMLYSPSDRTIVVCDEMRPLVTDAMAISDFRSARANGVAQTERDPQSIDGILVFIVLHEVGHALIAQRKIAVLGNEEDAADGFAAWVLLRGENLGHKPLIHARNWLAVMQLFELAKNPPKEIEDFHRVHPFLGQRDHRLNCFLTGYAPEYAELEESENERRRCRTEWRHLDAAWRQLLLRYQQRK